jgi:hypothetical protein
MDPVSAKKLCKDPTCERRALDQAVYCEVHVGVTRRCKKTREVNGRQQRCKAQAMVGLDVCVKHGGSFPQSKALSERSKVLTTMQRFIRPYEGELTLVSAFEEEFRRTVGRIHWLNEQIGLLSSEKDLIWGLTKKEVIGAGEEPGTNKTYEAKVHILEEMLRWERVHLLNIEKLGIGAGLEQQRLDMLKTYSSRLETLVSNAFEALGLDVRDPKVLAALKLVSGPSEPIIDVEAIEA